MRRALVTFATGEFTRLLELALPGFEDYAGRHGYELLFEPPRMGLRPPSWMKVSTLLNAFDHGYRELLWIDCDVVVVDGSRDIVDELPADAWQGLVRHHTPDGEVPNCGVWYLRAPMAPVLEGLWRLDRYLNDPWWEQAALLDLLGYRLDRPVQLDQPTALYDHTHWLGLEWNSHEQSDRSPEPRFAHATHGDLDWRSEVMRSYIDAELATKG